MYEITNNLAKVQDTRKAAKKQIRKYEADMTKAWKQVNPDRHNLVNVFGGAFRIAA